MGRCCSDHRCDEVVPGSRTLQHQSCSATGVLGQAPVRTTSESEFWFLPPGQVKTRGDAGASFAMIGDHRLPAISPDGYPGGDEGVLRLVAPDAKWLATLTQVSVARVEPVDLLEYVLRDGNGHPISIQLDLRRGIVVRLSTERSDEILEEARDWVPGRGGLSLDAEDQLVEQRHLASISNFDGSSIPQVGWWPTEFEQKMVAAGPAAGEASISVVVDGAQSPSSPGSATLLRYRDLPTHDYQLLGDCRAYVHLWDEFGWSWMLAVSGRPLSPVEFRHFEVGLKPGS